MGNVRGWGFFRGGCNGDDRRTAPLALKQWNNLPPRKVQFSLAFFFVNDFPISAPSSTDSSCSEVSEP